MPKATLFFVALAGLAAVGLIGFQLLQKTSLPSQLSSMGYEVDEREVTFRGHESSQIVATKGKERLMLQALYNVEEQNKDAILKELIAPLLQAKEEINIFDPYTGQEVVLDVPEKFWPVKKETIIKGQPLPYYLTHANIIFSLRLYTDAEVRYYGLYAAYFCQTSKAAQKLELYYPSEEEFNEEKALALFSQLYCSK